MEINGLELDVDIPTILRACGIKDFVYRGNEYRAHCPHHSEKTPSWDINTEGIHSCFGCGYKGNVVKLLLDYHPEIENPLQAIRWLFEEFNIVPERKPLDIEHLLQRGPQESVLEESLLDAYDFRHPYLHERGFVERTLLAFRIGYCKHDEFTDSKGRQVQVHRAVTIPWRDRKGRLRVIKYRPIEGGKHGRYINRGDAQAKKSTVFALDKVLKKGTDRVALCEGEFDAMYCWQAGVPAVAIGSAYISREQVRELQYAGLRRIDLFLDNPAVDEAGKDGRRHAVTLLGSYFKLFDVVYPREVKDANDLTTDEIKGLTYTFM